MKKGFVEVVFILDMSGSMLELTDDVIGGFNSLIENLKEKDFNILVTTVLFNTTYHKFHNRVPISEIKNMTRRNYLANGCTALLDAIGFTIDELDESYKEQKAEKTLVYITTDGMENSSNVYSYSMINKMIKWHTDKEKWEIIFLAANIDEEVVGAQLGIPTGKSVRFEASHAGMRHCMDMMLSDIEECMNRGK